jgi:hypothetical protein
MIVCRWAEKLRPVSDLPEDIFATIDEDARAGKPAFSESAA